MDAQERDALEAILSDCESADLLIYAPQAGPLSGIYTAPGGSEALLIVQDHFGETVTVKLRFEAGPDGQITPSTWLADFSRLDEPPAGYGRYFPGATVRSLPESFAGSE